jgi:HK97 family phage portal protein
LSKSKGHKRKAHRVEQKSAPAASYLWGLDAFLAANTIAGPAITAETAMRCTPVSTAVSLIADTVGTLPVKLYARDEAGGKEPDHDHPAYALIHDEASPWISASQLRTQLTTDALLHGNGYAFANRVGGRVVEFNRLDPRAVSILVDDLTGEPAYRVSSGSAQRDLAREDVLHIPAFSLDGVKGVSPVHLAREAIALTLVLEQHASRLFANGGRPSGILKFPGKLDPASAGRMKESWQAAHAGSNAGGTAIIEQDGDFRQLAFSSVDAQFMELRTFQTIEIARAFRVPPSMLFELGRATWGNAEEMGRVFYQLTLLPWLRTWTDALSRLLLSADERKTHAIEFVVDDLMRADTAARAAAYAQLRAAQVLTANECRALENRPALAGGDTLSNPNITTTPTPPAPEADAA